MYKTVKVSELRDLTVRILTAAGETEENALLVFENLLEDEYMGKSSHGFYRIPAIAAIRSTAPSAMDKNTVVL